MINLKIRPNRVTALPRSFLMLSPTHSDRCPVVEEVEEIKEVVLVVELAVELVVAVVVDKMVNKRSKAAFRTKTELKHAVVSAQMDK